MWDLQESLAEVASAIGATGARVDVTNARNVTTAMQTALEMFAAENTPLAGVIHCAGILKTGLLETFDPEVCRAIIDVNLLGTIRIAQAAIPALKPTRGSLILMASVAGFIGVPDYAVYGASKAGVINLAQALRVENATSGVHIGVVCPNTVDTPMVDAQTREGKMVKRFGIPHTADDIASVILRALHQRRFMAYPGVSERFLHWLSRATSLRFGEFVMRMLWR